MTEFETRLAEGASLSAADSERDARTLNTLVRLFDKLQDFDGKSAPTKKLQGAWSAPAASSNAGNNSESLPHDADRIRHELAQRLEKLRRGLCS